MSSATPRIKLRTRVACWEILLAVVMWVSAAMVLKTSQSHDHPVIRFVNYDPASGAAILVLTNSSNRTWEFVLISIDGQFTPSYRRDAEGRRLLLSGVPVPRPVSLNTPIV